MLKRKKKQNKIFNRKSQLIIVGSLLIIVGVGMIGGKYLYSYLQNRQEDKQLEEFYEIQEEIIEEEQQPTETEVKEEQPVQKETKIDYVAVLKIPKIGLEKGLCKSGTYCNNVNRNVQILKESSNPDEENGNVILAGHSGNARISYFRKLDKLVQGDEVSIIYNGHEYKYKVVNIYDVEKIGTAHIVRNSEKNTLTLITCRHNTNKQIVVICELTEKI